MPQGENFWNPFRLVPIRDTITRKKPNTDEKFRGHSGTIECSLVNLTPLFIGAQSRGTTHPPLVKRNKRVIPGSSLKGMLRNLAELIGGGCFIVADGATPVPNDFRKCTNMNNLCITCSMFGALGSGQNARVHKGKVTISEANIMEDTIRTKRLRVLLANNKLRHEPFYRSAHSGRLDGKSRKLYFHQPRRTESVIDIPVDILSHSWEVDALLPNHHFTFSVQFTSLTDGELALLLYVINLEREVEVEIGDDRLQLKGPLCHKIGNGKPSGMGSCQITINQIRLYASPGQRFGSLSTAPDNVMNDQTLATYIDNQTSVYRNDQSPTMVTLRKIMVWDPNDPRDFRYPPFKWFRAPGNGAKPLKRI